MTQEKILVTGGSGYVGSHTCVALCGAGYRPVIFDNFSNSSPKVLDRLEQITRTKITLVEGDILNFDQIANVFQQHDIKAVMHFAGCKAVDDSVKDPLTYYRSNVSGSINLIDAMKISGVDIFIFSSSATIFGELNTNPISEAATFSPKNPYGKTKLFVEEILADLFGSGSLLNLAALRYFNPVGAHPSGLIGEDPKGVPQNLMPYLAQVAVGRLSKLEIFGRDYPTKDGTGVRDYIHVMDVADAHVATLDYLLKNGGYLPINLGTGNGVSVLELIHAFEKASGQSIPWVFGPRRKGDAAEYYADPSLAKKTLGWSTKRNLDNMCLDMWHWQSKNPNGY